MGGSKAGDGASLERAAEGFGFEAAEINFAATPAALRAFAYIRSPHTRVCEWSVQFALMSNWSVQIGAADLDDDKNSQGDHTR
jgi:hypothetical protein